MAGKSRLEVTPISTLGELNNLLEKAKALVDIAMPAQTQSETPFKFELTMKGKIRAIVLTELDPERIGQIPPEQDPYKFFQKKPLEDEQPMCIVCEVSPRRDPYGKTCGPSCSRVTGR